MASFDHRSGRSKARSAFRASLAASGLLAVAVTAHAQTTYKTTIVAPSQALKYTITTSPSSPSFYRPTVPTANGNAGTTFVPTTAQTTYLTSYGTSSYTASATGNYSVNTTFSGFDQGNFAQFIYSPSFSAASPLTNAVLGFDDYNATSSEGYNTTLTAGTAYTFVNTGYYSATTTGAGASSNGTSTTTVTNLGSTTAIPDASRTNGATAGAAATQSLTVTDTTIISSFDGITIVGLNHTSLGDLTATLSHGGVTVDLFDHTGATNNTFQGDPGSGAQFSSANTYTFAQNGADLSAVPYGATAASGVYKAASNTAGGFDRLDLTNTLSSFIGQSAAGLWTLSFTDHQADDIGSFTGFSFTINTPAAAPEPSQSVALAIGLLGLGVLAMRARRKSRAA